MRIPITIKLYAKTKWFMNATTNYITLKCFHLLLNTKNRKLIKKLCTLYSPL